MIKIGSLSKIYSDEAVEVAALSDVNLEIHTGEFTAIVGPSGSGKTTLLNLLGGLDTPSSGRIEVEGWRIDQMDNHALIEFRRDHVGFIFQSYNLIPVLTVEENVEFVMALQGKSEALRRERSRQLLTQVGLLERKNAFPSQLSGGQQQRVAVARALATKPHFVLADEPTANLDGRSAENLLDIMEELNRNEGVTFLFSTHDPRVMRRARRVITLEDGKVVGNG